MKTGDIVNFNGRKDSIEGVVIGSKWSRRGQKVARQLNASLRLRGVASQLPEGQMVVEVADLKNEVIWTTSANCKVVGKATRKQLEAGRDLKGRITCSNIATKQKVKNKNIDKLRDKDLTDLQPGDDIEIKYADGYWKKEVFSHYTSSGKIAFLSRATKKGVRYCWPAHVRKAE
ncbi:MAG: hypothetical protein KAQ85_03270 [Thermodesulfovibrionia bacterium]|nr:hypothetical protein [Thermodesulfovibrionia bacterium]